jgi:hypothetical protein
MGIPRLQKVGPAIDDLGELPTVGNPFRVEMQDVAALPTNNGSNAVPWSSYLETSSKGNLAILVWQLLLPRVRYKAS